MRMIFNAVYIAIFLSFLRKILGKVQVAFNVDIKLDHDDDSDEYFVFVEDTPIFWQGDLDEARAFVYSACARCPSVGRKLRIVESEKPYVLQSVECARLSEEETAALNATIDEME